MKKSSLKMLTFGLLGPCFSALAMSNGDGAPAPATAERCKHVAVAASYYDKGPLQTDEYLCFLAGYKRVGFWWGLALLKFAPNQERAEQLRRQGAKYLMGGYPVGPAYSDEDPVNMPGWLAKLLVRAGFNTRIYVAYYPDTELQARAVCLQHTLEDFTPYLDGHLLGYYEKDLEAFYCHSSVSTGGAWLNGHELKEVCEKSPADARWRIEFERDKAAAKVILDNLPAYVEELQDRAGAHACRPHEVGDWFGEVKGESVDAQPWLTMLQKKRSELVTAGSGLEPEILKGLLDDINTLIANLSGPGPLPDAQKKTNRMIKDVDDALASRARN